MYILLLNAYGNIQIKIQSTKILNFWQALTLKGKQMIQNQLTGVGIKDGDVATAVAGQKLIISGFVGIAVLNPFRSHILIQNV